MHLSDADLKNMDAQTVKELLILYKAEHKHEVKK
jgi:hypothetical protein